MKLEPLGACVVVRPTAPKAPHGSVVRVVWLAEPPAQRGVVEAVGPDVRDVRVGERVVFGRLQGVVFGGVLVLPETAILAKEDV